MLRIDFVFGDVAGERLESLSRTLERHFVQRRHGLAGRGIPILRSDFFTEGDILWAAEGPFRRRPDDSRWDRDRRTSGGPEPGDWRDVLQTAVMAALEAPDALSVTADIEPLVRLHNENPKILRRYLATNPAWRVFEQGNRLPRPSIEFHHQA